MFLKRLDVSGFKSFANKTSVTFVPGVTAVVGPNGSGKSNITEAIRWVLGEQSAKSLRGSKMEDIIFSGSDARKAVNVAGVTLTLDNHDHYLPLDYSEISVTRRVFRSGESEFMLNGQTCRLKDIIDLFMDSGLGKEAYSVIGQGKIDEILNSKAEDKRRIFEEAAGVLKYKLRKQQAERKLEDSQDDLSRVEDILHELQGRLDPLEKQASIAKDYLAKKEELERVDVALLAQDIATVHEQWEKSKQRAAKLRNEKAERSEALASKEAACSSDRHLLEDIDRSIDDCQTKLAASGENLEKMLGRQRLLDERRKHAENTSEEMKERMVKLREQLAVERKAGAEAESVYRQERQKLRMLREKLERRQAEFNGFEQNLDDAIEKLKSEYIEVLNQQAAMRNEQRYLTDQRKMLVQKRNSADKSIHDVRRAAEAARAKRQRLTDELDRVQAETARLHEALKKNESVVMQGRERYNEQKEAIDKIGRFIEQATSKKDMLEALKEDYAGFYQGVKAVLKHRGRLSGICGAVAELIRMEKTYETALETALGASSQSVIVTDEAAGRRAIAFLRKNQAGRATFLPISIMRPRSLSSGERKRIEGYSGFLGTAGELVVCRAEYRSVINHLLGTVLVAGTLEEANHLAGGLGYKYRIVTLDGDVVAPGGAMTGGSRKKSQTGLIGRASEIEQLEAQIKEMRAKVSQLENDFSELKNSLASDELRGDQLRKDIQRTEEACRKLEGQLQNAAAEEKTGLEKYSLLARENGDFTAQQQKIEARLKEIDGETARNKEKEQQLTEQIEDLTEKRNNRDSAKAELETEMTALKVETAGQNQIVIHQKEKREQIQARVDELAASIEALGASVEGIDHDLDRQSLSAEELSRMADQMKHEKERLTVLLTEKKQQRASCQIKLSAREEEIRKERDLFTGLTAALQEEEVAISRLDVRLDHLLDTLREDYQLTIEAARENYRLELEPDAARKKVKLIKRAIDELGTVNVGAIEEYQQVLDRHRFLTAQKEDLMKARETLEHVITEMDDEVAHRFSDSFRKIRQQFQIVFRELFGGGQADLRLLDPGDKLGSGIDILAEPPGKKLQHLSLLSGGERALTAIALLFAILKVRPVPFCVLDEVEAALDDANVDRYADFLKKFSRETQFIVVTHRHGTMEHADVLYGVTMQESGISRLVSVRLEETEELLSAQG